MLRKTIAAALCVLAAACLAPAASAQNWKHHNVEILQNKQITLTGTVKVHSVQLNASVECEVTSQMSLLSGTTTAVVTKFEPDLDAGKKVTEVCKGGGVLAFCQIHAVQPVALPWQAHNLTNEVRIIPQLTHISMTGGFCPVLTATITEGTVLSTPNQPKTVSSLTLGGCARLDVGGMEDPCSPVTGTLNILAPNAATYSLE